MSFERGEEMSREDALNFRVVYTKVCDTCKHYIYRECWCNRFSFHTVVLVDCHYVCDFWKPKVNFPEYGVSTSEYQTD